MQRTYKCTYGLCKKRYSTEEKLLTHINSHNAIGRYKCVVCNYTTDCRVNMKKHVSLHKGEYNYPCRYPACNYRSNNSSALLVHTRKHTKERPYVCPYEGCCHKTITNSHLRKHIKCKHNEAPLVDEVQRAAAILACLRDDIGGGEISVIDVEY